MREREAPIVDTDSRAYSYANDPPAWNKETNGQRKLPGRPANR